ncbi:MAG TPA: carboxypeptidase-like regulatory domain-containing protein [Candidatus Didemnitutus sp.]|nr:carboxypeptidase-like regulatory domain-containing protein [Candidatus Didemnitutus sp.]
MGILLCLAGMRQPVDATPSAPSAAADSNNVKASSESSLSAVTASAPAQAGSKRTPGTAEEIQSEAYGTPIEFYGKVVDQNGVPISAAKVSVSFVDNSGPGEHHTHVSGLSDSVGLFHFEGRGLEIVVMVAKVGYCPSVPASSNFRYAEILGRTDVHATPESAAIFTLRKQNGASDLICFQKGFVLARDGTPVDIDLERAQVVGPGRGDIRLQAWIYDQGLGPNSNDPYDWRFAISVPGGGSEVCSEPSTFEAPSSGYSETDEVAMPATLGRKWRDQVARNYFLKLRNNRFARVGIQMIAGGDHYAFVTSCLNPIQGDRNLGSKPEPAGPEFVQPEVEGGPYPRWIGGKDAAPDDARWNTIREREKSDPHWQGKMPIDFFGLVEDFDGAPVPGAMISFQWTSLDAAGTHMSTTTSDAKGMFSLHGAVGKFLGVKVAKPGYYASRANRYGFEFAQFSDEQFYQPDSEKPVVFRLRKKGVEAKVGFHQTLYGLRTDGAPQYIDLRSGVKTTGGASCGDIELRLVRSVPGREHRFDWSFQVKAVGKGGLIESGDEFMLEAPEKGYVPSLQLVESVRSPDYRRQLTRTFYIRLADGETYGKVIADVRPEYNDAGAVDLRVYVNLEGTRNLEFDETK